jgi:hypothetical protein
VPARVRGAQHFQEGIGVCRGRDHFLALRNIEKDWKMPARTWKQAVNQFAIMYGERFSNANS